jgi:hypothetical protein
MGLWSKNGDGLDADTLEVIRLHAAWVNALAERAAASTSRSLRLSAGELDSWGGALQALVEECDRLRSRAPTKNGMQRNATKCNAH